MKSKLGEEGNEGMRMSDSENSKICNCNQNMNEELFAFFWFECLLFLLCNCSG